MRVSKLLSVLFLVAIAAAFLIVFPSMSGAEDPWAETESNGTGLSHGTTPPPPPPPSDEEDDPEDIPGETDSSNPGEDNPYYGTPFYWLWLVFGGADDGGNQTQGASMLPEDSGIASEETQSNSTMR